MAGFTLGPMALLFRQSHVGSSIFTCSAAAFPCGMVPNGEKALWGGEGANLLRQIFKKGSTNVVNLG